jgi:hypothetical protein
MSHTRVKIKYEEEGPYGSTTEETLYCHHNHTCDIVLFYYGDGEHLVGINEFSSNNLWTAMEKLMYYHKHEGEVEYWDEEDRNKIMEFKPKPKYSVAELHKMINEEVGSVDTHTKNNIIKLINKLT